MKISIKKLQKIFLVFLVVWGLIGSVLIPSVFAQDTVDVGEVGGVLGVFKLQIPRASNFWGADGGQGTIFSYIAVLYYAFSIIILIAFIFMEIWGGIIIMTSNWEQSKLDKGKAIMKNGFVGIVALLLIFGVVLLLCAIFKLGNPLRLASSLQSCGGEYGYESGLDTNSGNLVCNGSTDTWCIQDATNDNSGCTAD